jgi:Protein phosphatase 2C
VDYDQNPAMPMTCNRRKPAQTLSVVEVISAAAGAIGDDRAGYAGACVWVIDGATDCAPQRYLPGGSDAAWLAEKFHRQLLARAKDAEGTLPDLLAGITASVREDFHREQIRRLTDRGHQPSAAALIARLHGGVLEVAGLGDCQLFAAQPGSRRACLHGVDRSRLGDRAALERIQKTMKELGLDWHSAHAKVKAGGTIGRRMMNTPGGYSVLSIDMAPLDLIQQEAIPLESGTRLLFATDGFTRLYEVFGAYSEEMLLDAAFEKGLAALIFELRELEAKDEGCEQAPRVKVSDDATAILVLAE